MRHMGRTSIEVSASSSVVSSIPISASVSRPITPSSCAHIIAGKVYSESPSPHFMLVKVSDGALSDCLFVIFTECESLQLAAVLIAW